VKNRSLLATDFKDARLELQDYETLSPIYGQTIQFFNSVFGFIATLIGVIVLFTVGNTMSMAVVERTVEIGTLRGDPVRMFLEAVLAVGLFLLVLHPLRLGFLVEEAIACRNRLFRYAAHLSIALAVIAAAGPILLA